MDCNDRSMNLKICNDADSINPNFYRITDAIAVVGFQPMRIKSEKNDNEKIAHLTYLWAAGKQDSACIFSYAIARILLEREINRFA